MLITKLINDLKQQCKSDWKINPSVVVLEFLATFFNLLSAATLACMGKGSNLYFVFTIYLLGSVCMFAAAKLRKNIFYLVLSIGYTIVNITGLVKLVL